MEIKTEISQTKCDLCGITIPQRMYMRNDGSFQSDFLHMHEQDFCIQCSARILGALYNLKLDTSKESFEKGVNYLREHSMDLRNQSVLSKIDFFNYANQVADGLKK